MFYYGGKRVLPFLTRTDFAASLLFAMTPLLATNISQQSLVVRDAAEHVTSGVNLNLRRVNRK